LPWRNAELFGDFVKIQMQAFRQWHSVLLL
jgi:hypothetical protein